jgi:GntR family transcriptional repressor for pyruvate dehydrogenase complex
MENLDVFYRVKKVRVADTVVNQIISLIENGTLKVGDYLPSERELLDKFNVARASVREALRILEYQGIIEVQSGKGSIIIGDLKSADIGVVKRWFNNHASEFLELLDVCQALECHAAHLAAINAPHELIEEMQETLNEADGLITQANVPKLVYLDHKFDRLLGKASCNHLLSQLIDMLDEVFPSPRLSLFNLDERAKISLGQHRAVFNAIIAHDPITAQTRMKEHFESVRATILEINQVNNS